MSECKCENCKCEHHCGDECPTCKNDVCIKCECEHCKDENKPKEWAWQDSGIELGF